MYRHILAAIDGSYGARLALEQALVLAQDSHAAVTAICVIECSTPFVNICGDYIGEEAPVTLEREAAAAALEEANDLFSVYRVKGKSHTLASRGKDIATVLSHAADMYDVDLVVMGTHGRRGLRRFALGSVAESFLRISNVPVLFVRHDPESSESEMRVAL